MFARTAFRSHAALRTGARGYSTAPPPQQKSGGGFGKYLAIFGVASFGVYGYRAYKGPPGAKNIADAAPAAKVFTGKDQGFVSLVLKNVKTVNHNTKEFTFAFDDENAVSGLSVASALLTKYKGPEDQKPTLRPYTPTSDEETKGFLTLLVKQYPNGPMSTHMHEMKEGQRLDFKGPLPKYPWAENKHEHIALVAGGTGITPMYQLTRAIFNNPNDKTKVTLVFGNVTEEDILLKKEFEELENNYPNRFKAFYLLDKPTNGAKYTKGFITKDLLKTVLPDAGKGEAVKVFVCGPPGLYKAVSGMKKSPADQGELSGYLSELGYSKDQVYKF